MYYCSYSNLVHGRPSSNCPCSGIGTRPPLYLTLHACFLPKLNGIISKYTNQSQNAKLISFLGDNPKIPLQAHFNMCEVHSDTSGTAPFSISRLWSRPYCMKPCIARSIVAVLVHCNFDLILQVKKPLRQV